MVIYLYHQSGQYHKPDYPACAEFGKGIMTKCNSYIGKYNEDCQALNLLAYPQHAPSPALLCDKCFNFEDVIKIAAMPIKDRMLNGVPYDSRLDKLVNKR